MSSTDELSNVVPTSDPYEELLGPSPLRSSDPYEEVNIPGFSQRDETRDAVDVEFKSLHDHAARRELRRSRLQMEMSVTVNPVHPGTPSTPENYHAAKRHRTMAAAVEDIEYDLLRLHCDDLKEERDKAQEESAELREECKRLRQELDQHPEKPDDGDGQPPTLIPDLRLR
ncbi:hypothetical protein B0H14DRAFT_3169247 [Mycena olivaceomarginata]|nr:hypothetical protein B0H14DRAFT_3169247 [Mycena olivaceomarginata]